MPAIQSAVVAANAVILVQDKPLTPVLKQTFQKLVDNLPKHDSKVSYQISGQTFHCLVENTVIYACVSDNETQPRTAYGMLAETKEEFKKQFGDGGYPKPADLTTARCNKFGSVLAAKIRYFNENPQGDKIGKLKNQIEDVKQVMLNNIDEIMERGARIDNLVGKSESLLEQASDFEDNSKDLYRAVCCRRAKIIGALLLLFVVIAIIIAAIACKGNFKNCGGSSDEPAPAPAPAPGPSGVPTTAPTPTPTTTTSTSTSATTTTTTTTTTTDAPTTTSTSAA